VKIVSKIVSRVKRIKMVTLLRVSAVLTILGLAMMIWSLLVPTPMPVMLAMSVGQAFGTMAFGLYLLAIVIDLRRNRRARRESLRNIDVGSLLSDREEQR
jgi:hypothetical protein